MKNKMQKIKNKKGQIFTILAIVLIGLVFLSFEFFSFLYEGKSIKSRVISMDSFLSSIEENMERQIYISGFRIIFLAENKIASSGTYISDIDAFFQEAFFNGTVNGVTEDILSGATYNDIVSSVNDKAKKINVDITMENSVLYVSQTDPWNVNITLISDFVMTDREGLARWEKKQYVTTLIPVTFFEDPVYTVNSFAKVSRKINQTIYEGDYVNGTDVSNLRAHAENGLYAANTDAPNFLMRLEGNLSDDVQGNGIESFVDTSEFQAQGLSINTQKSVVDHIYFNPADSRIGSTVTGMQSWFKIDTDHEDKYQIP